MKRKNRLHSLIGGLEMLPVVRAVLRYLDKGSRASAKRRGKELTSVSN
jgi:hypothetical protein